MVGIGRLVDQLINQSFGCSWSVGRLVTFRFLVTDTRLNTLSCRQVGKSVGWYDTFFNSERFTHDCSCPTISDWIAVYPALFVFMGVFRLTAIATSVAVNPDTLQTSRGWFGRISAVMRNLIAIQKCYGRTDTRTDGLSDTAMCRVTCPRLKTGICQRWLPKCCCQLMILVWQLFSYIVLNANRSTSMKNI